MLVAILELIVCFDAVPSTNKRSRTSISTEKGEGGGAYLIVFNICQSFPPLFAHICVLLDVSKNMSQYA